MIVHLYVFYKQWYRILSCNQAKVSPVYKIDIDIVIGTVGFLICWLIYTRSCCLIQLITNFIICTSCRFVAMIKKGLLLCDLMFDWAMYIAWKMYTMILFHIIQTLLMCFTFQFTVQGLYCSDGLITYRYMYVYFLSTYLYSLDEASIISLWMKCFFFKVFS